MDRPSRTKQTPKILDDMIFQEDMDALLFLVCSSCLIVLEKMVQKLQILFNASLPFLAYLHYC